jgi:hypothetical protein
LLSLSLVQRVGACQMFDEMAESNASSLLRWRRQSIAPSADRWVLFWVGHGNSFAMLLCCPEMLDYLLTLMFMLKYRERKILFYDWKVV